MLSPAAFLTLHPEFRETDPLLINATLLAAAAEMGGPDAFVWGPTAQPGQAPTISDVAQGYCAADLLITSPFGTEMRKADGDAGPSQYRIKFEQLQTSVGGGFAVAGVVV